MDRNTAERKRRLDALLQADDIYRAYEASALELEDRFEQIAQTLPPEQREVLVGYSECLKLMQLRMGTVACEHMEFET